MKALIRCTLRLGANEMQELCENEDLFFEAWGQVKFYLQSVHTVKFSA
jgi:hypothetical protein